MKVIDSWKLLTKMATKKSYFKDFASGAMIENIVRRSKKTRSRSIATGSYGIRLDDLLGSIRQEYCEHEDLPNTTNPDDWAKISGKGERIISSGRSLARRIFWGGRTGN